MGHCEDCKYWLHRKGHFNTCRRPDRANALFGILYQNREQDIGDLEVYVNAKFGCIQFEARQDETGRTDADSR